MSDNQFTNQDDEIAAANAARLIELEGYRQRLVSADADPTNYSPDYTDRDGQDLDADGLSWSTAKRQYLSTGGGGTIVANWRWDHWDVSGGAASNLALHDYFPGNSDACNFGIPFDDPKWDDEQYGATKYQNPDYPANADEYGTEYQLLPQGHLVQVTFTAFVSRYFGSHEAADIASYRATATIDSWPESSNWNLEGGISYFCGILNPLRLDRVPAPWSWSTLPTDGFSEGLSGSATFITPYDKTVVGPSLTIVVSGPSMKPNAAMHLMSMTYLVVDHGPI